CIAHTGSISSSVKILPESPWDPIPVEVGRNFTATCHILPGSGYTSSDISWAFGNKSVPEQAYHRINETAVSVTVNISSGMNGWLKCSVRKPFSFDESIQGILLKAGYPPEKPTNLKCIAVQEGKNISPNLKCSWEQGSRNPQLETTYTLHAKQEYLERSCTVNLSTFPLHMDLRVWLEVKNKLGSERTLVVTWKHPLDKETLKLTYAIRYCQAGSSVWIVVPENFTRAYTESYRLQSLEPYTQYVVQMRSIEEHHDTYWSDWSPNATIRTAEAKPASAPDLWRIIHPFSDRRNVTLVWKAPVKAYGAILHYDLGISQDYEMFSRHVINADKLHSMFSFELLPSEKAVVQLTAANSAGISPKATLFIPGADHEISAMENMRLWVRDGQLQVEWSVPSSTHNGIHLSEFLVEWTTEGELQPHWQRVPRDVNSTILNGNLAKFRRYNISVYPVYKYHYHRVLHIQAGRPQTKAAYIQEGAPEKGPTVMDTKSKKNSVELTWDEIPLELQRGFITNYTIFYKTGSNMQWQSLTVGANIRSYVLTDLLSESDYVVHIMASTEAGSKNGTNFNFKTMKYGDGEVELIVVVVCLSFLFITVFMLMLCLRKRQVIKKLLWPQVPDPSDSSLAHWSPDFPVKADMPKEDVSVVEVDVFDRKSLYEEDKLPLPLKKDKYLSEEHSSGIGGSSCMSSPRHSVSDSDEGDSGQTSSSTVQYSSVMASGYKGQTPVFSRSESTQPLLEGEEHLEQSGDGQGRHSYFRRGREIQGNCSPDVNATSSLSFCPVEEEEALPALEDSQAGSYMPQQSGYRPQ
ncbi:hypothetical protein DNTS_032552, partial [Danionella cerebrum]